MKHFFGTLALLAVMILAGGGQALSQPEITNISALELGWAFGDDARKAARLFEGKKLRITGRVTDINMYEGRPALIFKALDYERMLNTRPSNSKKAEFSRYSNIIYHVRPDQTEMITEVLMAMFSGADYTVVCELKERGDRNSEPGTCNMF